MKAANRWLLFAAFLAALVHSPASPQAQPARRPAPPAPPAGTPTPPADASTPIDDDPSQPAGNPAVPAGDPALPAGDPASITDEPAPAGGVQAPASRTPAPWDRGVSAESRKAARALFLEGNRLMQTLLFARAAEKYVAALSKWKHPRFYYNLAAAQIGLGQEVEARESLEKALAHGAAPLGEAEFQEAQKKLQDVTRQLGRIRVICQTPGAEVTLDGTTLFTGPGIHEGWVKAKAHELTAKKTGYLSEARRVTVAAGKTEDIELKLVTLSQATDASRRWAAWKPWAVVAAGGAIAAAGGGLHALAARGFNAHDKEFLTLPCVTDPDPASPGCRKDEVPSHLNDQLTLARREQTAAVGAYIVGGSLIAAGIVLLYLNQPRTVEQRDGRSSGRGVAVAPAVSVDMLGMLVSVSH